LKQINFITGGAPCSRGPRAIAPVVPPLFRPCRGAVIELRAMETFEKQKIFTNYACFCLTTILTSKIITEIIENLEIFSVTE